LIFVIDSSVASKWFAEEPRHEAAKRLILAADQMIAPDWAYAEVVNALWRKVRANELTDAQVRAAIDELPESVAYVGSDKSQMQSAFELAQQLGHSIYDCVFLALALSTDNTVLVTDDNRFAEKAAACGYADKLRILSDDPIKLAFSDVEMGRLRRLHASGLATIETVKAKVSRPTGVPGLNVVSTSDLKLAFESPVYVSLKQSISGMTPHQTATILALAWLGRGYDGDDFDRLYDHAANIAAQPEMHAPYIISLITYIDRGIARYRQLSAEPEVKE
jgi:predicted nucleic acid-binding protein